MQAIKLLLCLCLIFISNGEVTFTFPVGEMVRLSNNAKLGYHSNSSISSSAPRAPVIPFILHQSWKTIDLSTYSPDTVEWQVKNSRYTTDFLKVLWTDADILQLVERDYPELLSYYKKLNMNIKRADLSRYLIVHKYGGVYMDLDIELRKNITELFLPTSAVTLTDKSKLEPELEFVTYLSIEYDFKKIPFAGNAFFGAVANCSILSGMIERMKQYKNQAGTTSLEVLRHSGPLALGLQVNQRIQELKNGSDSSRVNRVKVLTGLVVGNLDGNPTHAAHRRKHSWKIK